MRPSRPTAIRSKKNSCGDRHARRREAERRSRQSALVLVANRQRSDDTRRPRGDLGLPSRKAYSWNETWTGSGEAPKAVCYQPLVFVDVGAPAFLLTVVDDRLAARDRGSAAARRFRPLSAVAVPRRHARLVRVVSVVRAVAVLRLRARCFKVRHGRCPPKMTAPARRTCGPAAGAVIDSVCWWEPRRRYRGRTRPDQGFAEAQPKFSFRS